MENRKSDKSIPQIASETRKAIFKGNEILYALPHARTEAERRELLANKTYQDAKIRQEGKNTLFQQQARDVAANIAEQFGDAITEEAWAAAEIAAERFLNQADLPLGQASPDDLKNAEKVAFKSALNTVIGRPTSGNRSIDPDSLVSEGFAKEQIMNIIRDTGDNPATMPAAEPPLTDPEIIRRPFLSAEETARAERDGQSDLNGPEKVLSSGDRDGLRKRYESGGTASAGPQPAETKTPVGTQNASPASPVEPGDEPLRIEIPAPKPEGKSSSLRPAPRAGSSASANRVGTDSTGSVSARMLSGRGFRRAPLIGMAIPEGDISPSPRLPTNTTKPAIGSEDPSREATGFLPPEAEIGTARYPLPQVDVRPPQPNRDRATVLYQGTTPRFGGPYSWLNDVERIGQLDRVAAIQRKRWQRT